MTDIPPIAPRTMKYAYYALVSSSEGVLVGSAHGFTPITLSTTDYWNDAAWQVVQEGVRRAFIIRNPLIARDIRVWLLYCVPLT